MYGVDWGSLRQLPADREINGLEEEQEVAETLSDVEVVRFAVFFRSVIGLLEECF